MVSVLWCCGCRSTTACRAGSWLHEHCVALIWREQGIYIKKDMGGELASRANLDLQILPNIGHYPHVQDKATTIFEVRPHLVSGIPCPCIGRVSRLNQTMAKPIARHDRCFINTTLTGNWIFSSSSRKGNSK
ncbi:hypothetical protein AB4156_07080 [Cupriavidus sp. 2MCAB6]|uniref:hypothetical protein n=1 Tax=Cupriavidus sp. 2MCAB6 TaxID=3232981 RepID=UPI003F8EF042